MALKPKLTVLAQDTENYGYITVQDSTGVYNVSTNPGGYGAPNPAAGDVMKAMLRAEYFGAATPSTPEQVSVAAVQGSGVTWEASFHEGVTKIVYLVGLSAAGSITALEGNTQFDLAGADSVLANADYIELDGDLYQINKSLGLSVTGGYVITPFVKDYTAPSTVQFVTGDVYTLWKGQGYRALVKDIGDIACTSAECASLGIQELMGRYRFHLAIQPNFDRQNYSKAHNLAVALAPDEVVSSPCITC